MYIATSADPKISLRQERNLAETAKAVTLLRSCELKKDRQAINISPRRGEATKNVSVALPN